MFAFINQVPKMMSLFFYGFDIVKNCGKIVLIRVTMAFCFKSCCVYDHITSRDS